MCGIFCALGRGDVTERFHGELIKIFHNRGPDSVWCAETPLGGDCNLAMCGHVQWQQGSQPQQQPTREGDCLMLFNGDIFNLDDRKPKEMSDTKWLAKELAKCEEDEEMLSLLKSLEGPHCLILYNKKTRCLYFARDAMGRTSLIIEKFRVGLNLLSTSYNLMEQPQRLKALELPPLGLYKLHIDDWDSCILYPWQPLTEEKQQEFDSLAALMNWQIQVGASISPEWLVSKESCVPSFDFYDHCSVPYKTPELLYKKLLKLPAISQTLDTFDILLKRSVAARVQLTAPLCRDCTELEEKIAAQDLHYRCPHAKVCLLFSGGIDCSILALLAHHFVPKHEPIELINVAFEKVGGGSGGSSSSSSGAGDWNVPDRQTAEQTVEELRRLCPKRCFHLLKVNVTREEMIRKLNERIRHLIYPLETVLDESLGTAFWFAAATSLSSARVALVGSGADELFGGYTRHRNAYRRCKGDEQDRQQAVLQELEYDWQRIPARNLARDDRVIADASRTARAPFIEEQLVQFVRSLKPEQRCCFQLPEGLGDKLLLRLYGYRLGLRNAAMFKKRAIQFGSRIADKKQQAQQKSQFLCPNEKFV